MTLPHSQGLTPKGYSPTTLPRPHKSVESPAYPAVVGPTNRRAKRQRVKARRRERKRKAEREGRT